MKTWVVLCFFVGLSAAADDGIQCPKNVLTCQLQTLTHWGTWRTVDTKQAGFVAFNSDEPSEAANDCGIDLSMRAPSGTLAVHVNMDLQTFVTPGTIDFYPALGKEFTARSGNDQTVCVISPL